MLWRMNEKELRNDDEREKAECVCVYQYDIIEKQRKKIDFQMCTQTIFSLLFLTFRFVRANSKLYSVALLPFMYVCEYLFNFFSLSLFKYLFSSCCSILLCFVTNFELSLHRDYDGRSMRDCQTSIHMCTCGWSMLWLHYASFWMYAR